MLRSVRRSALLRSLRNRWRLGLFCLLAVLGAVRIGAVDGLWRPIPVTGPSMAPTLWGPSLQLACPECGISLRLHKHPTNPLESRVRCANCGGPADMDNAEPRAPDQVLIDRGAYWWRGPKRGELVAIRSDTGQLQVKRVIGVPGDEIGLDGSLLRINGKSVETGWHDIPAPVLDVFDAAYPDAGSPRWQRSEDGRWMVYRHRSVHDNGVPAPIRDDYPANTSVARQLMPVAHKRISGRVVSPEAVRLTVDIWLLSDRRRFRAVFPAGDLRWSVSSLAAEGVDGTLDPSERWRMIRCEADEQPTVSPEQPIAIQTESVTAGRISSDVRLSELTVARHFRWYVRRRDRQAWPTEPFRLQAGRYFVVGDNLPMSEDSRAAPQGIERSRILGRVIQSVAEVAPL